MDRNGFDDFDLFETCEEYYNDETYDIEIEYDPVEEFDDLIK